MTAKEVSETGLAHIEVLPMNTYDAADLNLDGTVDAADYVLWRNGGPLENEVNAPGTVNQQDYVEWRSRFGNSGSGSGLGAAGSVPEPGALVLLVMGLVGLVCGRRVR